MSFKLAETQPEEDLGLSMDQAADLLEIDSLDDLDGDAEEPQLSPEKTDEVDSEGAEKAPEKKAEEQTADEADQDQDDSEQEPLTLDALADALDMSTDDLKGQLKVTRKVNGLEEVVTLAELQAGNQREADYTRKTEEHAHNVREFEETRQAQQAEIAQQYQQAYELTNLMQQQLQQEYQSINWAELESVDPGNAALQRQKYHERAMQYQQVQQHIAQTVQQNAQQAQLDRTNKWNQFVEQQVLRVPSLIPEWSDQAVAAQEKRDINQYLSQYGLQVEDASQLDRMGPAEHVAIARKAMLYDRLMEQGKATKQKVAKLPKLTTPGKKRTQAETAASSRRDALKKFRKTQNLRDAADAIPDELIL